MKLDDIRERLQQRLAINNCKRNTVKAKLIEHEFLQGFCFANTTVNEEGNSVFTPAVPLYLVICMMSGRSILDA